MTVIPAYATANQVTAPWQNGWLAAPERHPSRAAYPYRARGTRRGPLTGGQVWPPKRSAAAERQRAQQLTLAGGTLAAVAIASVLALALRDGASVSPQPLAATDPVVLQTDVTTLSAPESNVGTPVAVHATTTGTENAEGAAFLQPAVAPPAPAQLAAPPAAPVAQVRTEVPQTPTTTQDIAAVFPEVSLPPLTTAPNSLPLPARDAAFVCSTCTSAFPQFDQVSFAIFAADPEGAQARALAENLAAYPMTVSPPAIPITQNAVRFYRTEDAAPAAELAAIYAATLVDLTWFSPDTEIARIEVMFAPVPSQQP